MTAPRVCGLDLSLTSTGIALPGPSTPPDGTTYPAIHTITTKLRGIARCDHIADTIIDRLWFTAPTGPPDDYLVAIEGYSYSSRNSHAHALGELGGIVRSRLRAAHVRWVDIPPASLKRYACGRGNAPKDQVLVAAVQRLDITPRNSDEADAAWLRALTLDAYEHPIVTMPKQHRSALAGVEWPNHITT